MAAPRVFISSTCYDLKYIRENIKYFISTLGYESILSEDGDVYYDPNIHTHDACLAEVPNCQIFILIIGGRFGGKYKDSEYSITNAEYRQAISLGIPVFALVEQSVYNEHLFYTKNKKNPKVNQNDIIYPNVDNIKIFDFIDEVRKNTINNALIPFVNFNDIESYLKKQWAGMMFNFLTQKIEKEKLKETLTEISTMNERIQMLSKQILNSVGTTEAKVIASLYEEILGYKVIQDLMNWRIKPTIKSIVENDNLDACIRSFGIDYIINEECDFLISQGREISEERFKSDEKEFLKLRNTLIKIIDENNIPLENL